MSRPIFEGHACRACSEGHACHARRSAMDNQTLFGGPDEQVPPNSKFGGACLSCPAKRDGSSNVVQRTRQARPSEKRT